MLHHTLERQEFEDMHSACDMQNLKGSGCGSFKNVLFSSGSSNYPRGWPYWEMNVCVLIHIRLKWYWCTTIILENIIGCIILKNCLNLSARPSMYPTSLPWARCNTRSVFKQSKAGLKSEFTFSKTGCLSKAKELSLLHHHSITGRTDSCLSQ